MKKQNNPAAAPVKKTARLNPRHTGPLFSIAFLTAALCYILFSETDYLLRVQELNLFLYSNLFFKQQLVVPGGLLTWLGTYFTQFFYYPWLGTLMLFSWLGLMMWLTARAFGISRQWMPVLLLPVALVLLTDFDLGYWLYYLKLRGHFFITVMGVSMAAALVWLYRVVPLRYVFMMVAAVVAYPVAGFYGLLAVLLMAVITWRLPGIALLHRIALTALAVLLIVGVPHIFYRQVYYQTNSDFLFWQALPVYPDSESFSPYYIVYILLAAALVAFAAFYRVRISLKWPKTDWQRMGLQLAFTVLVGWGCWHFWYKDTTFREELRMEACVDHGEWEKVLTVMRQHEGEPTRMMVMFKNLALFKLGRAGDEMYRYADGSKEPACSFDIRIAQIGGKNIYFNYGLPNYCYRWCLEDGVEFGWRIQYLKFLVRCALLNDEWVVARKYIDLLKQTRFHRSWAEHYEAMATPQVASLVAADAELGPIRRIMSPANLLGSDQSLIELFLLNLQASRVTKDPVCAELVLLSALQLKSIPTFWRAFNQYAMLKKDGRIPRYFQEAAYLYGNLEHTVDISHMPFDPSIPASYQAFMQAAQQYQGASEEELKVLMRSRFGDTFYYNYFLMRNMKTY